MLYSKRKVRKHLKDCEPIHRELNEYFHSKYNKDESTFILHVQNMSPCTSYSLEIIHTFKYLQK
jgi:hypothetical protein